MYISCIVSAGQIKMGCNSSVNGIVIDQDKELKEYLKPYDIRLVQESWNLLQDDLEHVGLIMFHRWDIFRFFFFFFFLIRMFKIKLDLEVVAD